MPSLRGAHKVSDVAIQTGSLRRTCGAPRDDEDPNSSQDNSIA